VVSLGDGRVLEAGWKGGYGRYISIRHNSVYTSSYAHLSGYAKGIKAGTSVKQGAVIGYVGSSGLSTGAHLDFRVYRNGSPVDPLKIESPPTNPVDQALMDQYKKLVDKLKMKLDSL
jgi:murein DD-endopeptidase MepM/ murein hydrolase activator NlpD